jgi:hypothetical protein
MRKTIILNPVPTRTNVAASVTSVQLLAANASRLAFSIYNDSATADLYVAFGTADASATSFTVKLGPGDFYESPTDGDYSYAGAVQGLWSVASGTARMTEVTT